MNVRCDCRPNFTNCGFLGNSFQDAYLVETHLVQISMFFQNSVIRRCFLFNLFCRKELGDIKKNAEADGHLSF